MKHNADTASQQVPQVDSIAAVEDVATDNSGTSRKPQGQDSALLEVSCSKHLKIRDLVHASFFFWLWV